MKPILPAVEGVIPMTDEQIAQAVEVFRSKLRENRGEFDSEAACYALRAGVVGGDLLGAFRRHVALNSGMMVRRVTVNRDLTPQEMLVTTGLNIVCADGEILSSMLRGCGNEVDVYFFKVSKVSRWISNDNLWDEYMLRGLKPDMYAQAAVNASDSTFAESYPNGCTQSGQPFGDGGLYVIFDSRSEDHHVRIGWSSDEVWPEDIWYGGVLAT